MREICIKFDFLLQTLEKNPNPISNVHFWDKFHENISIVLLYVIDFHWNLPSHPLTLSSERRTAKIYKIVEKYLKK